MESDSVYFVSVHSTICVDCLLCKHLNSFKSFLKSLPVFHEFKSNISTLRR